MKTNIDDATLQAAIDEACEEIARDPAPALGSMAIDSRKFPSTWIGETRARLALASAFLARLPEPTTPVVDGKTPAEIAFRAAEYSFKWESCANKDRWHRVASAVLAAFGGAGLEAAIARMESVSDEQRIAIAQACGWKGISSECLTGYAPWRPTPYSERVMGDLDSIPLDPLPDYLNDLNAMHEAEKTIKDSPYWNTYETILAQIVSGDNGMFHITAAQRAEAFLRTLNLWK